ncbi:MAG: glycosyltransferase [Elusimicrobiota bacterium]
MKVAIIAPPWDKLPSRDYIGIGTTIYNLAEELNQQGHHIILFAPFGSISSADTILYPENRSGIDFENSSEQTRYYFKDLISKYACSKAVSLGADIIHNFTLAGEFDNPVPCLHTLYQPPENKIVNKCTEISKNYGNYFVSVSNSQRALFEETTPEINFIDCVYKSIDIKNIKPGKDKESYFLYMGQIEQQKSLELAKRVTEEAGKRLVAVIQGEKKQIYSEEIKPWLNRETSSLNLQFPEELPEEARYDLFRKAKGTFFVSRWEEPFGMEMLESLACGTPVIALRKGAASEVIIDGKTGYLVDTEKEMINAVKNIGEINPAECRKHVAENFSSQVISKKYLKIYKKIQKLF